MENEINITPYAKNAKKHPAKQIKALARAIEAFGFSPAIEVDVDGVIVSGHGRFQAAQELGLTKTKEAARAPKGADYIPYIILKDLTPLEIKQKRLADNKLAETDVDMILALEELKDIQLEGGDITLTGYDEDLLVEPDAKDDEVPENAPSVAKLGDLWALGPHRVLCGDSTSLEAVERLMEGKKADVVVTDPPYNTGMQGKGNTFDYDWTKKKEKARLSHMFDDKIENWPQFIEDFLTNYFTVTKGECAFYVFIDWRKVQDIREGMEKLMDVKNVIVWDKGVHGLGSDYKSTYELCIVGKKGKPEIHNRFGTDYQDIWRVQRKMGRNKDHATAKPVELLEKPILHASKQDDIVLDLFLGSGSTLIAAEKTGRICYGMELDEKYMDVIIKRWEDYTGQKATKL